MAGTHAWHGYARHRRGRHPLTRHRRARVTVAAVLALAALALSACGAKDSPPANTPLGDSQLGGAPPASTTPATTGEPVATTPGAGGGGNHAPVYPKGAKAYAQELLKAWSGPDFARLGQLATQSAVQQIRDSITYGGKPNSQWTHIACEPAETAGFTACLFRNAHGDEAHIKLAIAQLGFPTAVTEANLARTEYANDPGSYAANFMNAWREGNRQRMARLSSAATADYFAGQGAALSAYTVGPPMDLGDGHVKVQFTGLSDDSGRYYTLKVLAEPDEKAYAIKGYCSGADCEP